MADTDFERAMQANAAPLDEYLDELIVKASPQWQGVDVDAFMDTVRGREPETITEHLASISEDWAVVLDTSPPSNHPRDLVVDLTVSKKDLEDIAKTSPLWRHYL